MTNAPLRPTHAGQAGWLDRYADEFERDPDYVAEKLALRLTEEAVRLMEKAGLSRSALADLMGVSKPYVTRILNAPSNLTLRSIAQLALALGAKPHVSLFPACGATEDELHGALAVSDMEAQASDSGARPPDPQPGP